MKYCHNCNKDFPEDRTYCDTCGKKLSVKVEKEHISHHGKHTINKSKVAPWLIPWIVFGVLLVIAGILLLPTKVVSYQVEVPYIDTEKYTFEVPYEDVEEYTLSVPYETKEQYVESVPVQNQEKLRYIEEGVKCSSSDFFTTGESTIKITNLDTEAGIFTVKIGYNDNSGNFVSSTQSKSIVPSRAVTFTYSPTPGSFKSCNNQIQSVPTKTTTDYKDVIKERTVTKYRDETKYRKVTKTRTETREKEVRKTKTEIKQKELNWVFDFDAIIKFRNSG